MKYPYDIVSYVRTKTFSVEARLHREEEESPLKVFNHFSRYIFTVIQDSKAAICNIHVEDIAEIVKNTDYAYNKHMEYLNKPVDSNMSIAYTTRFATGNLKGKSPIDVLVENPENGKKMLNDQYKWLKENLANYPNNQKLIDAIIEAGKMDLSSIESTNVGISAPITIFEVGCRPLVRKTREDGKAFCYECKIVFDSSKKYPVSCVIKNYYAPVEKKENGLFNVLLKQKDKNSEIINEFNMTAAEWLNAVSMINMSMNTFYMVNFNSAYKLAEEESKKNRESNKKSES